MSSRVPQTGALLKILNILGGEHIRLSQGGAQCTEGRSSWNRDASCIRERAQCNLKRRSAKHDWCGWVSVPIPHQSVDLTHNVGAYNANFFPFAQTGNLHDSSIYLVNPGVQ
ncbi:hypothetical protein [Dactylosporangium sp. NPDC050588]|uniref:hypothetical protein n=1 Tax=Dactylosporangium sp. NPDC050588 TaxID=3157211 RepID=UPI0033E68905